jgi:hypothetical protein
MSRLKRSGRKVASALSKTPLALSTIEPNLLRDRLLEALWDLTPENQAAVRNRLLTSLEQGGMNIGIALFLLGILASTPDELTPTDLSSLIRFACYNSPQTMQVLAAPLSELLAAGDELKSGARHSRLAA